MTPCFAYGAFQFHLTYIVQLLDTSSLVDAQIIKIKMLSSENENILAEKHIIVEELSCKTQLLFQKDRDAEKLLDQQKQLKVSLDELQLQQSHCILAEKNSRRMIEIEIDNCIERICGFGSVIGDELVEGALDAAGVGHSLGSIKDQPTMILIGLMSKLSKMNIRMTFIPILWEHHGNKLKWKCLQKWKSFYKSSSRAAHLYSFQNIKSLRARKAICFASWKASLRISKRLYFMQKEKDQKLLHAVFTSFVAVFNVLTKAQENAARLSQSFHIRMTRHYFLCWAIVIKQAVIFQKQTLRKAGALKTSNFLASSLIHWHVFAQKRKFSRKFCCALNFKLKVSSSTHIIHSIVINNLFSIRNRCCLHGKLFVVTVASWKHIPMHCKGLPTARCKDMC